MSKKKKIIIGSSLGVAAIIIIALLMVFVFDTFGMFTSEYKLNYDKYYHSYSARDHASRV